MNVSESLLSQSGTWVPTWTGFSTDPTSTCYYTKIGNLCICSIIVTVNGTSDATGLSVTLPFNASSSVGGGQKILMRGTNNGVILTDPSLFVPTAGSNIAVCRTTTASSTTSWTIGNGKAIDGVFAYITE